jgi:hypothetical protein
VSVSSDKIALLARRKSYRAALSQSEHAGWIRLENTQDGAETILSVRQI